MRTRSGDTITLTDPHRHKFNDALTEYVYARMDAWAERSSGDVESPLGWYATVDLFRIIRGDERGFVWLEKFRTEEIRDLFIEALDECWGAWAAYEDDIYEDDPRFDMNEDDRETFEQDELACRLLHLAHLYRTEEMQRAFRMPSSLPTFEEWKETT